MGVPESEHNNLMHATISVGDGVIMGSDMPSNFGAPLVVGNNFSISYSPKNRADADELFGKISASGSVTMPLGDQFWGAYFGACTDKFGINWMLNMETGV